MLSNPLSATSIANAQELHQGWYPDDGTFVGPLSVVQHAVQVIIDRAPAFGLSLNPQKSRVWSPVHHPLHLNGFPLGFIQEHRAGLSVLGAPITLSLEFADSVAQALVDAVTTSLSAYQSSATPKQSSNF